MIGTIVGDIAGSRFERHNHKSKEFELFTPLCTFTDDTVMSLALCDALLRTAGGVRLADTAAAAMQAYGRQYENAGYGGSFIAWIWQKDPKPYGSYGNGAAMRAGGCGWAAQSLEEAKETARIVTNVTHNHPEAVKAAEAVAAAIYLGRSGADKNEIRSYITEQYYPLDFTLDAIRDFYDFDVSCQGSVPQAFQAFFEAEDFEDTIRNAISIGGDSDTIAAISGSIAEAHYGVPEDLRRAAEGYLDEQLLFVLQAFEARFGRKTA